MPKKASDTDTVDPVRSALAGAVSGPVPVIQNEAKHTEIRTRRNKPEIKSFVKPKSMSVNRKFMVTPSEAEQIARSVRSISEAFGSKVTYSQISRAMWTILNDIDDGLRAASRRSTRHSLPSTGDALGMAEYEEAVTDFIVAALKRS